MRNIKILSIAVIVIIMITSQSCKKGFFEGVNDNPNLPTEVTPRVLLPGAEGNLAFAQGGDFARYTSIMSQYVIGYTRQFGGYQGYVFNEDDFNNLWNNMYAATMENFKVMMDAETNTPGAYNTYDAIARILMAYSLAMTTDVWGDVPYAEAFQGNADLTPGYQTQQSIYDSVQSLLTTGINELTAEPGDDFDVPDANDFIYGGDPAAWIAFAHALKARYYIHVVNTDGSTNGATSAQAALDEIAAAGDIADAGFPFSAGATAQPPWYQYITQRDDILYSQLEAQYIYYDYTTPDPAAIGLMISRNDPRLGVYIDLDGSCFAPGYLGCFYGGPTAEVYLMTYFEEAFIEAEANLRVGNTSGAQDALQEAINASFTFYGLDAADTSELAYIDSFAVLSGDFNTDLKTIITEKWIANYLHPESYVDYRRTGFPELVPNDGAAIPLRFIYPTNEDLYNSDNCPQGSTLFSPKLWWEP